MNKYIVIKVFTEKIKSPIYIGFFIGAGGFIIVQFFEIVISPKKIFDLAFLLTLFITPGIFGKEISSGTIQFLLTKPIKWSSVYFSKVFGVWLTMFSFLIFTIFLFGLSQFLLSGLKAENLIIFLIDGLLKLTLLISMISFFSTFLPDYGDIVAFIIFALLLSGIYEISHTFLKSPVWLKNSIESIILFLMGKEKSFSAWLQDGNFLKNFGLYLARLLFFLLGGLFIFKSRDYGYGQR
ncbi:hypothetical protein NLB96_01525 [Candidatus Aminicenantes bacterium AC-335-K20]|jgi:ABC-type transport system involved in multi-copper enzyme maturation permease subunit|nr:hypothetical protein [SCandidatus Aminicenantes bacterium Aminicenantia_JdfR_composite]MCP2597569.1 hypothetical protein [Candidatus Aminicenantes bacterium AC-335-G13]MCP2619435.1 hypothetical protein [Candidatus Aminicenantes bacterium AC-335-K20]